MIRIFEEKEVDFSHDGIEILDDITISCTCEREVNGTWFLDAQFMRDNDKCNSIENKKILKVPTPKGEQLFRIVTIKSTKTKISVYAEHIFFDNRHNFIEDTNVVKKDGNNALQQILTGCQYENKFTGVSTVPTVASARLVRKNLTDVLMGSDDNSYLNRWGGEIDFDNFQFTIKPRIGEDRGVEVTYGHNMKSFEGEVDESGVITRVMPIGFNGLLLPEKYIDSPLIDNYSFPRIQKIEISSIKVKENENDEEGYDTEEEAFEAMRQYVSDLYSKQNIDKPSVNLRVDIISLEKTDQYKNEIFERIYIGDTLKVNLQKYGFDVSCRVISERYDCLNSRYIEIELGDVKTNVLREVTSIKQTIDDILERFGENSWDDFIQKARDEATQLIQEGIKGSFVVARKNEILIMDNEDIEKAKTVIRMNKNGIGFSQTGYSGPYIIGITIDGKINADCITTGILNANLIRAGRLQSLNNKTWIDMEDGAFSFANGRITFDEVNGFKIKLSSDSDVDLKTELDNYKNQVKNDLDSLKDKIDNIDESISDSFVDGIISQVERNIIEDSLKTLEKEKLDVDSRYNSVYNNVNLINPYKSNLYTQYNNFVSKYNTLVSTINSIIADDIATNEEIERYNAAMGNYAATTPKLMAAFDEAITNISTNITSSQINDLNDLLKADIKNVSNSVGSLEETMNNSFRDGIIDEAEYIAIVESLQRLNTEKLDIDKNYSSLYSNSNLVGTAKTNLKTKYDNYVSSHNNLINYVNNTIGDRVATDSEKQQIKTLLNTYNINLSEYGVAQTQAINSIADNSSQTKLQEYKNLVNKDIDDLNQKIKDIETDVSGAIADGIIQEAEVLIIQNSINALEKEKLDLNNRYTELYNNSLVSTKTKKKLSDNFTSYSNAHASLINQINSMISDNVATDDEKAEYNRRMATYNSTFSALTKTFDLVINEIAVNNAQTITEALKTELQGNIKDVSDIANELNKNFGNYTADGILTESEKKSIKTYLTNLATEKKDIDNQYTVLYANVDLTGTSKSNLKSAYDNYVTYYNKLIEVINKTLGYTTITDSHRTALNTAFTNHDNYLATYSKRVNEAINAIAEKKKQDSQSYTDSQIEVLDDRISLRVTHTEVKDYIDNIEVGGRNLLKGTSSTYKTYTMGEWNYLTTSYSISDLGLQVGDNVTFRLYVKFGNVACGGSARITFYDNSGTNVSSPYNQTFITANSEGYSEITTKIPSSATKISVGLQRQTAGSGLASFTFQAKEMKLEKGNKPTDWTASPEDIQNQFNALEDLADELQGQIDGKIETWYQNSDPSTAWTTTALKTEHKGDIWHNTSTNVTYRWSGTAWNKLTDADAQEAKSLASSKAQVFTSTPTVPYYKGDLWVQGSTGDILRCVTARTSGSYTASDWNLAAKYTDDTFASSVQQQLNNLSIGGRNLVRNSSFTNGSTYWSLGTNVTLDTSKTFNGHPSIKSSQSGLTSNGWRGCSTLCLPNNPTTLLKDQPYTMSFYYYVENSSNFDYPIGFEIKGIKSGETSTSVVTSKNIAVANIVVGKWTRVVNTFTLSVDVTKAFIYAWVGKNGTAWFTDFKLEKGNKCTDWSPAPEDTEDYTDNLIYDLQDQLDNKIETFNQTADPSTSWTTSALKTQHTGDLWYNPSTMITKRWSGTAWVEQPDAETLAKTKRRVFTATPTVPYDVGDLWVTNLTGTGEIKTCKTAKTSSQSYSSSDWVSPKYTDDTVANQVGNNLKNNYYNIKQTDSAINTMKDGILLEVSSKYTTTDSLGNTLSEYATKSEMKQTGEDITAKFSQTGGINLIRNSSFWDGLNGWSNWGSPSTRYVTTTSLGYRNKLRLVTTGTNQGVSQEISDLEVGTKYTLSAYVNVESGNCVIMINNNGSYVTTVSSGTGKKWLELTFTASHTSVTVYLGRSGGGSNGTYDFTAIQLERGSTRSSWTPNANEICEGITTINEEGITVSHSNINATSKMTANGFYIEDSNGETIASLSSKEQWTELKADKVFANNIENVYEGDANLYVDHSKTVVGNGSANSPFSCFYELRDYLEKAPIINKDLTINVVSTGTISDTLYLRGLKGRGAITININKNATYVDKSSSHNFIYLYDVQNLVTINGGRTGYATNDGALISNYKYGVFANNCRYVRVEYIAINTKSSVGDQWGVIFNATNGLTYRVDFCDSPNAIYADRSSQVYDSDSCGNGTIAFYSANGSSIMFGSSQDNGYRPSGSLIKGGGNIVDLGNRGARASFRTAPAVPPTVNQYKDFSFSDYGYYSGLYGNWNSIGYKTVYQGDWGYGNNRGVFTLPNSEINSYLSGATILDGNQITLQRENAGGYSASQTVYLWGTTQTAASGSAPPLTKSYGALGTLAWGERKTFTLPKAFVSDLKAGTIKSVMFYTNDGSNYIKFSAVCTLRLKVNK